MYLQVIGLILQFSDKEFSVMGLSAVGFNVVNMLLGGATISVLSQMGFFAYLIVRFIAVGIIRSKTVWDLLQLTVVIVVLFDLVYLRMTNFEGSESLIELLHFTYYRFDNFLSRKLIGR